MNRLAPALTLTVLCALLLAGGCESTAHRTTGLNIEVRDGCSIIVTGFTVDQAEQLVRQLDIAPDCEIKFKLENSNANPE